MPANRMRCHTLAHFFASSLPVCRKSSRRPYAFFCTDRSGKVLCQSNQRITATYLYVSPHNLVRNTPMVVIRRNFLSCAPWLRCPVFQQVQTRLARSPSGWQKDLRQADSDPWADDESVLEQAFLASACKYF